jgi:hypothetical protein
LVYLGLRVRKANPQDYAQVESWYRTEFRRSWLAVAASWLLILAIVLGGLAGVTTALVSREQRAPQLSLTIAGVGSERTIAASATLPTAPNGAVVALRVTGEPANAAPVVLLDARTMVNQTGSTVLSPSSTKANVYPRYRLELRVDGRERGSLTVP